MVFLKKINFKKKQKFTNESPSVVATNASTLAPSGNTTRTSNTKFSKSITDCNGFVELSFETAMTNVTSSSSDEDDDDDEDDDVDEEDEEDEEEEDDDDDDDDDDEEEEEDDEDDDDE